MKCYFAPMEGITTYLYRQLHWKYFKGVDIYFTPFLSPTMHGPFTPKERKDILPENNKGIPTVPQILTNHAEYFYQVAKELKEYGYKEINLNLGCPSNTVAKKCKGAGFLSETYRLETFLDAIFEKSPLPISIKTRIGRYEEGEWEELLELYNRYPIKELIVHPRVQQDFYKKPIHWNCFLQSAKNIKSPLCYNGELHTKEEIKSCKEACPSIQNVMIGRGLLTNPFLLEQETLIWTQEQKKRFWQFHDELFEAYYEEIGNNALYKMKELWIYMGNSFPTVDKGVKKIRKAKKYEEYKIAVEQIQAVCFH